VFQSYLISDVIERNVFNCTGTCFQHGTKCPACKEEIGSETDAGVSNAATVNAVGACVLQSAEVAMFFLCFILLIGWQLSIWICCKPFFSLLYNCQLLCYFQTKVITLCL
jgi:hypothetical protein